MKFALLLVVLAGVVGALLHLPLYACEPCGGDGQVSATVQTVKCSACGGKGERTSMTDKQGVRSLGSNRPMCLTCKGAGVLTRSVAEAGSCLVCGGRGKCSMYGKMTGKEE